MASIVTIIIYSVAWAFILKAHFQRQSINGKVLLTVVGLGLVCHCAAVYSLLVENSTFKLGFFNVASLFFFVINLLVFLSSIRKPLHNLFIFLMPFSIIGLIVSEMFETQIEPSAISPGMLGHILLSVLAYSLLTIASIQALLLAYQNRQLKAKHFHGVMGIMPPLQTMETLLFDIVWAGFLFLSLSILTGVIYIDDILAQKLSHKTVFSVLSWFVYATLLAGHQIYGWRGAAAIRWVLGGFVALMLAYFGSKLVIEILLAN